MEEEGKKKREKKQKQKKKRKKEERERKEKSQGNGGQIPPPPPHPLLVTWVVDWIDVGKYTCVQRKINGSTSLENDNMYYVSFKIWE